MRFRILDARGHSGSPVAIGDARYFPTLPGELTFRVRCARLSRIDPWFEIFKTAAILARSFFADDLLRWFRLWYCRRSWVPRLPVKQGVEVLACPLVILSSRRGGGFGCRGSLMFPEFRHVTTSREREACEYTNKPRAKELANQEKKRFRYDLNWKTFANRPCGPHQPS